MHWWLIDLPAIIVTVWFMIIRLYMTIVFAVAATLTMAMVATILALYLFGIRWGW